MGGVLYTSWKLDSKNDGHYLSITKGIASNVKRIQTTITYRCLIVEKDARKHDEGVLFFP